MENQCNINVGDRLLCIKGCDENLKDLFGLYVGREYDVVESGDYHIRIQHIGCTDVKASTIGFCKSELKELQKYFGEYVWDVFKKTN